jgi:hypothetical protein
MSTRRAPAKRLAAGKAVEDPLKDDDTPKTTPSAKIAFEKLDIFKAPERESDAGPYFLALAATMRGGSAQEQLDAASALAGMSENSEMQIRLRKYDLLDPLLGLLSKETGMQPDPQIAACKCLSNLLRISDNQRFLMESSRSLPALRGAIDNAMVWLTLDDGGGGGGGDGGGDDGVPSSRVLFGGILASVLQVLDLAARDPELRPYLRNGHAGEICAPVIISADKMPDEAVLVAASTALLVSAAAADSDVPFGETEVSALRAIESLILRGGDGMIWRKATDTYVELAKDAALGPAMLSTGLVPFALVVLDPKRDVPVGLVIEILQLLVILTSGPQAVHAVAHAKEIEKGVKGVKVPKNDMVKSMAKMVQENLKATKKLKK